jgi:hypothetical protein
MSCDPTGLCDWLQEIGPDYRQYTYSLVKNDIDKNYLMCMTDEDLKDCDIANSIHRKKIIQKITGVYMMIFFFLSSLGPGGINEESCKHLCIFNGS